MDLSKELKVAISTGKVEVGYKVSLKALNRKKAKLIVMASNTPENLSSRIKQIAGTEVPLYIFPGSSWDLGGVCGKPYQVTTIAIIDPGESSILQLKEG
ncbi:MAG: 50S ribosomal protein L30e [Candidatus Methanomethylicaceae archaeon]|nr:50S ribosomal protein L30e [Candidatus Verstraetearchaeota archaeon]